MPNTATEEIVIPKDLQEFLGEIADGKRGFKLGDPWKYSETALAVVVPIIREHAPERLYRTMYEVLKEIGAKDTGHIDVVELQNKTKEPIFVRAGTIFTGGTQNRAAENSTVIQPGKNDVHVRCVNQTHGINSGAPMKYGDIAPMNVTLNLISQAGQSAVWQSVQEYTSGHHEYVVSGRSHGKSYGESEPQRGCIGPQAYEGPVVHSLTPRRNSSDRNYLSSNHYRYTASAPESYNFVGYAGVNENGSNGLGSGTSDLLGYMNKVDGGRDVINDMLQKVPLFPEQVGAIVFNPVGVVAVETFDAPKSWEAIKKEVIEKFGDKVTQEQAEHLFELKNDRILPAFRKFVAGLKDAKEHSVRKDDLSETRVVIGKGVVGEYTLVKGRTIHAILVREESN